MALKANGVLSLPNNILSNVFFTKFFTQNDKSLISWSYRFCNVSELYSIDIFSLWWCTLISIELLITRSALICLNNGNSSITYWNLLTRSSSIFASILSYLCKWLSSSKPSGFANESSWLPKTRSNGSKNLVDSFFMPVTVFDFGVSGFLLIKLSQSFLKPLLESCYLAALADC